MLLLLKHASVSAGAPEALPAVTFENDSESLTFLIAEAQTVNRSRHPYADAHVCFFCLFFTFVFQGSLTLPYGMTSHIL